MELDREFGKLIYVLYAAKVNRTLILITLSP